MKKLKLLIALFFISLFGMSAQELNCIVSVEAKLTGNENVQVFKTLESSSKDTSC